MLMIVGREIFMRDANHFHHLRMGIVRAGTFGE